MTPPTPETEDRRDAPPMPEDRRRSPRPLQRPRQHRFEPIRNLPRQIGDPSRPFFSPSVESFPPPPPSPLPASRHPLFLRQSLPPPPLYVDEHPPKFGHALCAPT